MAKIHTRQKRKNKGAPKVHKKGAKTFSSEEKAKQYAKENNVANFELKKVKKGKRFEIVKKD